MDFREKLVELIEKASYECDEGTRDLWDMREVSDGIADFLIANGVTVQEWISVKDRLPEKTGEYIVYGRCFGNKAPQIWICECICIGSVMGWRNNAKNPVVEAWTTLPQPPKGE